FSPEPALLFALPVVRRPGPGLATLFSGGYVASGTGTPDRLPRPHLPAGLSLIGTEGAGEVQTPVRGAAAGPLRPGDRVWLRHAKAGELAERFRDYHVLHEDGQLSTVPPCGGEGRCFGWPRARGGSAGFFGSFLPAVPGRRPNRAERSVSAAPAPSPSNRGGTVAVLLVPWLIEPLSDC